MNISITQKQLQQLLFIDDSLFKVEWQHNETIRDYDLLITLPRYSSEDERVKVVRKKMVDYLIAMEIEYLEQNENINK